MSSTRAPAPSPTAPAFAAPVIRVLGPATPEDVAAVMVVLAAVVVPPLGAGVASSAAEAAPPRSGSAWASRSTALRTPVAYRPRAWRTSLRP